MTMNKDILLAILSMDSYNRGYGGRINGLPDSGSIGNVTIQSRRDLGIDDATFADWQSAGFYAIAYNVNGETIISYRGTDNLTTLGSAGDVWSYGIGAGDPYNLSVRGSGYGTTVGLTKLRTPLN